MILHVQQLIKSHKCNYNNNNNIELKQIEDLVQNYCNYLILYKELQ